MNTKTRATILSAAAALTLTSVGSAATSWTIEERTTAIAPLDASVNALYGREAYSVTNNNSSAAVNTAWPLTDGDIKVCQGNPGLNINNNSSIRWKLSDNPEGVDLKSIRVVSTWGDKGRSQFAVASVAVKTVAGGDAWLVLANSGATGPTPTQKAAFLGTFADGNGDILASGATDLLIDFGPSQQNNYVGYSEVEAEIVPRSAESSWMSVVLTNAVPMVSSLNALSERIPDSFVNGGTTANPNTAAVLTDGEIPLKTNSKIVQINGNGTAGSSLEYSLDPGGVDLKNVRISSSWGDGGRSQIKIESLAVKTLSGGDVWQTLDNSALSGRPSISVPNWQATYSRLDGEAIATGATALKVVFDKTQQNGAVGYSEIEAEMVVAEVKMKLTIPYPASYGSVSMSPAREDDAYEPDTEVTLTAAAAAGYTFLHWYGDVPAGHEYDNPIAITMTSDKTVYPLFAGPWQWAGGVMTDGYWRVSAPLADEVLSMTAAEPLLGSPPLLDLRKGIEGTAAPLVSLAANALKGNLLICELRLPDTVTQIQANACANMAGLTNVVLSSDLQTIGASAFQNCQALTTVSPLLPESITSIGASAFVNVPFSGTLTIACPSLAAIPNSAFYADRDKLPASERASLKQVDLSGSGVESIADEGAFRGRLGITDVFLPAALSYLGKDSFYPDGTSGMRSIYFESLPACFHAKAFEGVATTARIVIYRDDQEWKDFLANEADSFTAWRDLSVAEKAQYTFDDSCVPYGRAQIGANGSVVFVATRKRAKSKATIISIR